ncbi:DUF2268 domain-containing putative Zn-dependent protease [Planctobacterium marinum]|uniref:DUF2268 domain-containing protein n=1 Tax=Planctobacterium marinum TaxID=1631968 RepID=A0AA48HID5_9ALTE|nr:hypothetical protein MACH26_13800 [Planctobacterium marinum]
MKSLLAIAIFWFASSNIVLADSKHLQGVNPALTFSYQGESFTDSIKQKIEQTAVVAERDVRLFFPEMNKNIHFSISSIDFDLAMVGHATGMAVRHLGKAEIQVRLSNFEGASLDVAIKDGLRATLLHELHHIARGWAIEDNRFPYGIYIATVNEGLAVVFSELLTGNSYEGNQGPAEVNTWVEEILALPKDANYMHWVSGYHPDGRGAIGYKTGRYIIYTALLKGNKNIIELSRMSIHEILEEAGFKAPEEK